MMNVMDVMDGFQFAKKRREWEQTKNKKKIDIYLALEITLITQK